MQLKSLFLLAAFLLFLTGCPSIVLKQQSTYLKEEYATAAVDEAAKNFQKIKNKAVVYIISDTVPYDGGQNVWVNDKPMGKLYSGFYQRWELEPGLTSVIVTTGHPKAYVRIKSDDSFNFGTIYSEFFNLGLNLAEGSVTFLLLDYSDWNNKGSFSEIGQEEGKSQVRAKIFQKTDIQNMPLPRSVTLTEGDPIEKVLTYALPKYLAPALIIPFKKDQQTQPTKQETEKYSKISRHPDYQLNIVGGGLGSVILTNTPINICLNSRLGDYYLGIMTTNYSFKNMVNNNYPWFMHFKDCRFVDITDSVRNYVNSSPYEFTTTMRLQY